MGRVKSRGRLKKGEGSSNGKGDMVGRPRLKRPENRY